MNCQRIIPCSALTRTESSPRPASGKWSAICRTAAPAGPNGTGCRSWSAACACLPPPASRPVFPLPGHGRPAGRGPQKSSACCRPWPIPWHCRRYSSAVFCWKSRPTASTGGARSGHHLQRRAAGNPGPRPAGRPGRHPESCSTGATMNKSKIVDLLLTVSLALNLAFLAALVYKKARASTAGPPPGIQKRFRPDRRPGKTGARDRAQIQDQFHPVQGRHPGQAGGDHRGTRQPALRPGKDRHEDRGAEPAGKPAEPRFHRRPAENQRYSRTEPAAEHALPLEPQLVFFQHRPEKGGPHE